MKNQEFTIEFAKRFKESYSYKMGGTQTVKFVELSEEEADGQFFDAERLANTLKIKVEDAQLLNSGGKTYVFAQAEDGTIYQLYHPSLSCNRLSISIDVFSAEKMEEFRESWGAHGPYAGLLGQTKNANHFVC